MTKPVVYDHFGTLPGLLTALYLEFDARQTQAMDVALAAAPATLASRAAVMAAAYVDCSTAQGRELPGVIGALQGTPQMHEVKRRCERDFMGRCRAGLLVALAKRRRAPTSEAKATRRAPAAGRKARASG